jgi:energy-coupling factor transporter ATP-binding protein EcfA2
MPSERDLIHQIQSHVTRLVQAVADAQFWHDHWLKQAGQEHEHHVAEIEARHQQALAKARSAYEATLKKVTEDIPTITQSAGLLAAPWEDSMWGSWTPTVEQSIPEFTRVGQLIEVRQWHSLTLPALLPIIGGRNVLIKASGAGKEAARAAMQSIMLRLLAALPPGKLRLVCIDPVGLGSTVAGFIKGLPDFLTGGQAWFEQNHIEQRLADLEAHMAFVKQKYLGVSFPTMEAYNAQAGQIEEPYRLLVIADFPARFTDSAAQRLISIATNGPGTGVYVLAMVDEDQSKKLYSFTLADLERTATIISCKSGGCVWLDEDFQDCRLELDSIPLSREFERIVKSVGAAAILASEVKVPFEPFVPTKPDLWQGDTRTGVQVPIGQFGARETQLFVLDEKLLPSALIIGRPGSGKSTLLHVLINSLALAYSPEELELYLLDLKEVEFKDYATYQLPHARVVAINCEREFGLSVLRGLDAELRRRMEIFRSKYVNELSTYRNKTKQKLPRVLLMVDEFQELFSPDDAIARDAGRILDTLVRQGRAFGINVLLASQTLSGPYTFSSATKNQIPIRIVLQCADADSRLALSDENDRARLLERPGEAIYNAANGRIEGNNRFQIAWLSDDEREAYLRQIHEMAEHRKYKPAQPQIVFEGSAPAHIENNSEFTALLDALDWPAPQRASPAWLGEPVEIKPHTAATFRRQSRANLLIVCQNEYEQAAAAMLTTAILSLAAQHRPEAARFVVLNLSDVDAPWHYLPQALSNALPHTVTIIRRGRDVLPAIYGVAAEMNTRLAQTDEARWPFLYLVVIGLHRARDLRRDESLSRGNDLEERKPVPGEQLAMICREGPDLGVHTLVWCDTYASMERVLERREIAEFGMRVALQMGAEDSRNLIDSDAATGLGPYRALFFDEERTGRLEKFRPYGPPAMEQVAEWGGKLRARVAPA